MYSMLCLFIEISVLIMYSQKQEFVNLISPTTDLKRFCMILMHQYCGDALVLVPTSSYFSRPV